MDIWAPSILEYPSLPRHSRQKPSHWSPENAHASGHGCPVFEEPFLT